MNGQSNLAVSKDARFRRACDCSLILDQKPRCGNPFTHTLCAALGMFDGEERVRGAASDAREKARVLTREG